MVKATGEEASENSEVKVELQHCGAVGADHHEVALCRPRKICSQLREHVLQAGTKADVLAAWCCRDQQSSSKKLILTGNSQPQKSRASIVRPGFTCWKADTAAAGCVDVSAVT